jgi:type IV secretory pathway component VirB8
MYTVKVENETTFEILEAPFDTFEEAIEAINKLNLKYYVLKREELANVLEKKHKERLLKYDK